MNKSFISESYDYPGQSRPTPYENLAPRGRSLYVQSTVQKITNLELTPLTFQM